MPKAAAKKSTRPAAITAISLAALPRTGEPLEGGKFAGIVAGDNSDKHDYALVDLGFSDEPVTFKAAQEWAEKAGGESPSRADARVLWANLDRHGQKKGFWFWTSAQYEGDSSYAWIQGFDGGHQGDAHKGNDYRARAVRRFPIQ